MTSGPSQWTAVLVNRSIPGMKFPDSKTCNLYLPARAPLGVCEDSTTPLLVNHSISKTLIEIDSTRAEIVWRGRRRELRKEGRMTTSVSVRQPLASKDTFEGAYKHRNKPQQQSNHRPQDMSDILVEGWCQQRGGHLQSLSVTTTCLF